MPSLFSRSRTTSNLAKHKPIDYGTDEFGRVSSRGSVTAVGKKDKKEKPQRSRTVGAVPDDPSDIFSQIPDGSFLPLNLYPPQVDTQEREQEHPGHDYGYLSYKRHVVLGLEQVARLVEVVTEELGSRGLTTPFIFSALALDVSAPAVNRLIESFLQTCFVPKSHSVDRKWREEARFAGPHELGVCLRWGLARAVRMVGGQEVRGLLSYESYVEWRDSEFGLNYPPTHFGSFLAPLDPVLHTLLITVLTLLIRLTAHSAASGHTPPTLSPLFGPLLFGLGPPSLSFHHTYHWYLRATNATEHIILAFIRWEDAASGSRALGSPARLKDWIRGYPAMLPSIPNKKQDRPQPRKGARTVRVANVRRNVRMYSPDLVKSAASWGHRWKISVGDNALAGSKEWERIAPSTLKLQPQYSDPYRKRMNLAAGFNPDTGSSILSNSSSSTAASTPTLLDDGTLVPKPTEERFRSLTDLKWGEFEASGFGNVVADEKKLQFDLTEGARAARAAKRATLTWTDFSVDGFSRTDAPLNSTLQFSAPVTNTINQWPSQSAELTKKLKKTQRALPVFGWDTEPVMASEEVIEEAFVDVFCDLVYGGGWMDLERGEEIDRECNWALVEFKSCPISRANTVSGSGDPRTSTTLMLFEEFVPWEYRQQLAESGPGRRRLPSLFSSVKSKQWKQASTLNGRPYVVGSVPPSPHFREVEFEGILRGNGSSTRQLTIDSKTVKAVPINKSSSAPPPVRLPTITPERAGTPRVGNISSPLFVSSRSDSPAIPAATPRKPSATMPSTPSTQQSDAGDDMTPSRRSRFRLPGGLPVGNSASSRRSMIPPAEYENVEFETRLASYSDDELNNLGRPMTQEEKRRSKDDAWVDILVSGSGRRYGSQDAELRNGMRGLKARRSDPELASQEVAQALAAAKGHPPSDDEDEVVMEPITELITVPQRLPSDEKSQVAYADYSELDPQVKPQPKPERPPSPPPRRRVTYFDLHPERRPMHSMDEDPRARLAFGADSDSELDYASRKGSNDIVRDLLNHGDLEPEMGLDHSPVPVIDFGHVDQPQRTPGPTKTDSMTLPAMMNAGAPIPQILPQDTGTRSKTAALIEMYREKERSVPAISLPSSPTGQTTRALSLPLSTPPAKTPPPRTPSPPVSEDDPLTKYDQSPSGPGRRG